MPHPDPATAPPVGERVYLALRADLMAGEHAPGDKLSEVRLAKRYGASRTPVREALARLISDGLVAREAGGLYPYRPRFEELAGLYELRLTLELRGITRVLERAGTYDTALLASERRFWEGLRQCPPPPDAGFVDKDERFHTTLLAAAGNPALTDALRTVNARIRPVRMYDYLTGDRMDATIGEHLAIITLLVDGHLDQARETLRTHVEESRAVVVQRAAEAMAMARMAAAIQP